VNSDEVHWWREPGPLHGERRRKSRRNDEGVKGEKREGDERKARCGEGKTSDETIQVHESG
jgi:hypothetical protein